MASSYQISSVTSLVKGKMRSQDKKALLWQNLLFVKQSPGIEKLDLKRVTLQEQKFGLVHTEASYNLRLELLREHFYENTQLKDDILTKGEYRVLFSNIKEVKTCSDHFLADLEKIWQEDIFLKDIFDVVLKHCSKFSPYARYCKDQAASIALLQKKIAEDVLFATLVKQRSERIKPICPIPLLDMLGLPRTRLTTMIPAIENALSKINPDDEEYESCRQALSALKQLTSECNETVRLNEDIEMLLELRNSLYFPQDMPGFALAVTGRCLDTTAVFSYHEHINVNLFEKGKPHPEFTVMLFNDFLLILEKQPRNSEGMVQVKDYCLRCMADIIGLNFESSDADETHAMLLRIKENSRKQPVDMLLSTKKKATRDWWVSRFACPLPLIPPHVPVRSTFACPPTKPLPRLPTPTRPATVATPGEASPSRHAGERATSGVNQPHSNLPSSRTSRFAENGPYVKNPDFVPNNAKGERHVLRSVSAPKLHLSSVPESSPDSSRTSRTSLEEVAKKPERGPVPPPVPSHFPRPKTISEDKTGEWTEKLKEFMELNSQIDFSKEIGKFALLSSSRWLVKSGAFTQYPEQAKGMSLFKTKPFKCEFLLFNDILLLSKAKKEGRYLITNYCKRNLVKISKASVGPQLQGKTKVEPGVRFVLLVTFLENHEKKREDLVFSCDDNAETDAWVEIFEPPKASATGEIVFHAWDCPTVRIVRGYEALTHTEMTVAVDEEIKVFRKCSNGMYEGERVGDHRRGMFPASVTLEVFSTEYARAKALRDAFDQANSPS